MTLALAPAPTDLIEQINHEYRQAETAWRDTVSHAIRCGELLHQAKLELDHGDWTAWLTHHFAGSDRTARKYMQLANAIRENPALMEVAQVDTITSALDAISRPRTLPPADQPIDATIVDDTPPPVYTLAVDDLVRLVTAFGGTTTHHKIRRWIDRLTEPRITLCPDCHAAIITVVVNGETITADRYAWEPRHECESCQQTRRAHPHLPTVSCSKCANTGYIGTDRPTGRMLAIDVGWSDEDDHGHLHTRIIGPTTDRRRGEALHPLHQCPAAERIAA